MITKSGTTQFHGSAYWYKRHEMFNAVNFFNNASRLQKPIYRFNTLGASLGGPVPIHKVRNRLFFFGASGYLVAGGARSSPPQWK